MPMQWMYEGNNKLTKVLAEIFRDRLLSWQLPYYNYNGFTIPDLLINIFTIFQKFGFYGFYGFAEQLHKPCEKQSTMHPNLPPLSS